MTTINDGTEKDLRQFMQETVLSIQEIRMGLKAINDRHALEDDEKRRREDRNWRRTNELLPQGVRENAALIISALVFLLYLLPHLGLVWRP